ncbi:MAG: hypothetical protein VX278_17960 [Myxococcota bacterium]|nr:hypothetical protein [Myxococcota bacterium]
MLWERKLVIENVKKILQMRAALPVEDGEIDFHFLSALEGFQKGKMSLITRQLIRFFEQDRERGDPAEALETLAAILLQWAAQIRAEKQRTMSKDNSAYEVGTRLLVRLPDHFPLYIGEVLAQQRIWIELLQREYDFDMVQVKSKLEPPAKERQESPSLQNSIDSSLGEIQKKIHGYRSKW